MLAKTVMHTPDFTRAYRRAKDAGVKVRRTRTAGIFVVTSATDPRKSYRVDARHGSFECACEAGRRGTVCLHFAAAFEGHRFERLFKNGEVAA